MPIDKLKIEGLVQFQNKLDPTEIIMYKGDYVTVAKPEISRKPRVIVRSNAVGEQIRAHSASPVTPARTTLTFSPKPHVQLDPQVEYSLLVKTERGTIAADGTVRDGVMETTRAIFLPKVREGEDF